jgi:hypothetical protein
MYGTTSGAITLVPAAHVSGASQPSDVDVERWLAEASSWIDIALSTAGYLVPADALAVITPKLDSLANLYAGAYVLRARGLDTLVGETEQRSDIWLREFRDALQALVDGGDLTGVGLVLRPATAATLTRRVRSIPMRRVDGYSGNAGYGVTEYGLTEGITD